MTRKPALHSHILASSPLCSGASLIPALIPRESRIPSSVGATRRHDRSGSGLWRGHVRAPPGRRSGAAQVGRLPDVPPSQRRGRPPHADHARASWRGLSRRPTRPAHPRTRPHSCTPTHPLFSFLHPPRTLRAAGMAVVDAQARPAVPRVWMDAAAVCSPALAPQRGPIQAVQAESGRRRGLVPGSLAPNAPRFAPSRSLIAHARPRHDTQARYLPEALANFVALLGWSPRSEREIFTLSELVDAVRSWPYLVPSTPSGA